MRLHIAESTSHDNEQCSWTFRDALVSFPMRLAGYAAITLVLFQFVFYQLKHVGPAFVGAENGPVEMAQVYLAIFASICLFYAACKVRRGRAGLIVCAAMVAYAAARESDSIFEALLFDDAYKYLVGLPMVLIAVSALLIDRRRVIPDAMWLVRQPSVALFAFAGIYLCGVCQVFDRPEMWSGISNAAESETIKATIEEFAELFAYLMLACSGTEALALAHGLDEPVAASDSQDDDVDQTITSTKRPRQAA